MWKNTIGLALLVNVATLGCMSPGNSTEKLRVNKRIVLEYHKAVWEQGEIDRLDELVAADYLGHWGSTLPTRGREALRSEIVGWRTSFPDWHEEVETILAAGDHVFTRYTEGGTLEGNIGEISPNGRHARIAAMALFRIVDGKIAEQWTMTDDWGMQRQLGIQFPDPGSKPGWN